MKRVKRLIFEIIKERNKNIKVLMILFFMIFVGITSTGTYAYFISGEMILPAPSSGTPVYNDLTINYTDHSGSQVVDDGVTVYFDISSFLVANGNWNAPHPNIYFFVKNGATQLRNNPTTWTNTPMILRFDSISTINPSNLSKCKTTTWISSVNTEYPNSLGGITWSGCWLKYRIIDPKFDLNTGETRYIIIKRDSTNDQTANNLAISPGVKEVYIKANATTAGNTLDWKKLEINY